MKHLKFIFPILLATFMISCGSKTETKTPEPVIEKADQKVKVKFDAKNKDLEIETDKVDIVLD